MRRFLGGQMAKAVVWVSALAFVSLAGCGSSPAGEDSNGGKGSIEKIRIQTYAGQLVSLPVRIGIEKGFYSRAGLDASSIDLPTAPAASAALAGGSLDIAGGSPDNLMLARKRGLPVQAVVGNIVKNIYALVLRRGVGPGTTDAPVQDVLKSLVGKKVGITAAGTATERFAKLLFSDNGIDPDDVKFAPIGTTGNEIAGLSSGQIDAAVGSEPLQTSVTRAKTGYVALDCSQTGRCPDQLTKVGTAFQVYYSSDSFIEDHPDAVKKFAKAQGQIFTWMRDPANASELLELASKFAPAPAGTDAKAFETDVLERSLPSFGTTLSLPGFQAWKDQLVEAGSLDKDFDVSTVVWKDAVTVR